MKRWIWGIIFSLYTYIFVLSLGHSYYLTQINKQLELTISELVSRIAEIQSYNAWDSFNANKKGE